MKQKILFQKRSSLIAFFLLFVSLSLSAQKPIEVKGTVIDANSGEALIGANVAVKGNTQGGTVTNLEGQFSLSASKKGTLIVSYIGYDIATVPINDQGNIVIKLNESNQSLNEIVVVGYGSQKKSDLTGAVSVVDMKAAKLLETGSIAEMLEGQVAGVSVTSSGDPGNMGTIRVRGIGSFSSSSPLYVVDGLIVNDVNNLNPQDIESMQVLKDASSTAIYGSRGSNGVIIITTKKGKNGPPTLDVSANFGVQTMAKKIKMNDTSKFLYYNEQAYLNAGEDWPAAVVAGDKLPNTDWQKAIFQTGFTQDYNASYSQGSEKTSLMMGAGYYKQTGILMGPHYDRFTYRVNSEGRYGIFKIGENITLALNNIKKTNSTNSSFTNALQTPPVIPVYDPDEPSGKGGYGYGNNYFPTYTYNAVALQQSVDNREVDHRVIGNAYMELTPWKWLTYKLNLGIDYWYGRMKQFNHCYTMRLGSAETRYDNVLDDWRDERASAVMEHTLTFNKKIEKHSIEALAGFTVEDVNYHYLWAEGYNQKVNGLDEIDLVGTQNNMAGSEQEQRLISYLGRINYNWNDRYLVQLNVRSDGSSKFGPSKRRGTFPSASFGWRINNEPFFNNLKDLFSNLKLRLSYGKIGDMSALGNYDYIPSIDHTGPYEGFYSIFGASGSEAINQGATQSSAVNTDLGWETKTTSNIGLDFNMLNNCLFGTIEWYNSVSSGLLVNLPQAWATGVDSKWTNYGKMRNRGLEVSLGWKSKVNDFNYSIVGNVFTDRNKVLALGDSYREAGYSNVNRTEVSRSIGNFYLIQTDGIFQNEDEVLNHATKLANGTVAVIQPNAKPGDVRYVDANGDGKIDLNDRVWSGSPLPKWEMGLTISASWKDIDFTMFWSGRFGNKIYNAQRKVLLSENVDNIPTDVTPWSWDDPSTEYPRMVVGTTDNTLAYTNRYLENGSYMRLKNLQLGYNLPINLIKKLSITRCRFYLSGQNLLTITKYKGYDPEVLCTDVFGQGNDYGSYPVVRSFNVGLQVSF